MKQPTRGDQSFYNGAIDTFIFFIMFSRTISLILLLNLLSVTSVAVASDTSIEQKIADSVQQNLPNAEQLLEKLVNTNSGTMNFSGVKKVGLILQNEFDGLGFTTKWIDGASFDRAGHLVATHISQNTAATKILMIGHLDTVFSSDDAFQTFTRLGDNKAAGPGVTDMKGGDVIILNALRALKQNGQLQNISIKVVMTGDEERSGRPLSESKRALIDAAEWADIALGFEDGDSSIKTAVIARRGSVGWALEVVGKPAHSSQIFKPEIGYGAIFEAARILNEFREQLAGVGNLTFNPGLIAGGTSVKTDPQTASADAFGKANVIAQTAKIIGGIRALTPSELENAKQVMQKIVNNNLSQTSATLTFDEGYPPLAPSTGNKQLLKLYSDVSESLGYGPVIAVNPRNAGAADISFTSGLVEMALDGLGLMGSGGHTRDEVADMTSFKKNSQKAAVLIYRLAQQPQQP